MAEKTSKELLRVHALRFIDRAESLGLKGKKRDDAALDYFVGAATVLTEMEHPAASAFALTCAMMIAVRGFFAVKELAAEPAPAAPKPQREAA